MDINFAALERVKTLEAELEVARAEAAEAIKWLEERGYRNGNGKGRADKGTKKDAKYRDPKNENNTWTGLGAMPTWLAKGYYGLEWETSRDIKGETKAALAEPFLITKNLSADAITAAVRVAKKKNGL